MKALTELVQALYQNDKFDEEQMHNYRMAVTERYSWLVDRFMLKVILFLLVISAVVSRLYQYNDTEFLPKLRLFLIIFYQPEKNTNVNKEML